MSEIDATLFPPSTAEISPSEARWQAGDWLALACAGILFRILLACVSWGSNDADTWARFARLINHGGILATYQVDREFNHPPLPGYWAASRCA